MIFLILCLLAIFSILVVNVSIKFIFDYSEPHIEFRVYIFRFDITKFIKSRKKKLSMGKTLTKNKTRSKIFDFEVSITLFIEILNKMKFLKYKPKFKISNCTKFGLDEADVTAVLYGYLTTLYGILIKIISFYVDLDEVNIEIVPEYNHVFLKFYFEGILKIRMAKLIYISFLFITLGRKLNGSTSNRKFDEKYT